MKKQMLAVLTIALITAGLAACGSNDTEEPGGSGSPMADGSGSYADSAASDGGEADPGSGGTETAGAEEESAQDEGEEKVRYIYGEPCRG